MKTAQPNILLIEDDASIVSGLKKELQSEGYIVAVAMRGDDGLAQAKSRAFDVVITDLKMPGLSGLELIGLLHTARPKLPIILPPLSHRAGARRLKHRLRASDLPAVSVALRTAIRLTLVVPREKQ